MDIRYRFPDLHLRPKPPTLEELAAMLHKARWYGPMQGVPIAWLQIPILMIGTFGLGGAALVSFIVSRTLVNLTRKITNLLAVSVGVETASMFHLDNKREIVRVVSGFGQFLSAIGGAIAGGLMLFGEPIIVLWTGKPEFFDPWILFWLLAPSILVAPALPLKNILMLGNLPRPVGLASLAQLIIGLILCYVLARTYGIIGAAAGLGLGESLALGILLPALAHHHIGLAYPRYFARCLLSFVLAASWCGATAWSTLSLIGAESIELFILSGVVWMSLGFTPALLFAIPPQQRTHLIEIGCSWVLFAK